MEANEFRKLVKSWCARFPQSVLFDEHEDLVLDVYSNRSIQIAAASVETAIERHNSDTSGSYLVILKDTGHQIVLSEPGIAWPPMNIAQIPMNDLPEVVCWRDFENAARVIEHHLKHHQDEAPSQEIILTVMFCTSVLAGARIAGFDVSGPERDLETMLELLERKMSQA